MKRILFLLTTLCLVARAMATDFIVGTGTMSSYAYPYYNYYKYSTEEFIYTPDEIPAGIINAISFYVASTGSLSSTIKIYLGHTDIENPTGYILPTDLTCVYSGTRTIGSAAGWEKISFSKEFIYNGKQDLVVVITKSSTSSNSSLKYRYTSNHITGCYRTSNSATDYASYSNTSGFSTTYNRPNTRFSYSTYVNNINKNYDFSAESCYYNIVSLSDLTCELTYGHGYLQEEMTIPGNVEFNGRTMTVKGINEHCITLNTMLRTCTLPESLETIGSNAFLLCTNLQSLDIPQGVTAIPDSMSFDCRSLSSLSLGENTVSIGKYAFYNCSSLKKLELPATIASIGDNAFLNCTSISELTIGDSRETLQLGKKGSYGAFYGLPIEKLYIGKNMSYEAAPFENNTKLKELTIGHNVTEFPDPTLATRTTLTELSIGDGLKEIPSFNSCTSLKKLTLGEGLEHIPSFIACEQIDTIYLRSMTPQAAEEFTNKIYVNCVLKVPAGSLAAYKSADVWKNFWLISEHDAHPGNDQTPKIEIDRSTLELRKGATATLTARLLPENVQSTEVQWESDNATVVSVSQDGVLTAIEEGVANIIARTTDGNNYSDTCVVTVKPPFDLGDVNDDGNINVADVNGVVNFILDTNTQGLLFKAADINDDNRILVDDLSDIISMVMNGPAANTEKERAASRAYRKSDNEILISQGEACNEIWISLADNDKEYSGLQFDITIPDGYIIDKIVSPDNEDIQVVWNNVSNNKTRIMLYSMSNSQVCTAAAPLGIELHKTGHNTDNRITIDNAIASDHYAKAVSLPATQYLYSEVTSISQTTNDNPDDSNIYNVNGQKVLVREKGMLYIYKGKKYIH